MRLFAAVFPPPQALEPLHDVVRRWQPELPQLTWVAPELWHITLAFYGEVCEPDVDALCRRVDAAARGSAPMRLQLTAGGSFPDARDPRVFWAGVAGEVDQLAALASAVAVDDRPLHPHLTLARVRRRPASVGPLLEALSELEAPPFVAGEVVVMHSEPGAGGAPRHYTPLATFPLLVGSPGVSPK